MASKEINVVIAQMPGDYPEEFQSRIRAVSSCIKLKDISSLITSEKKGDFEAKKRVDTVLREAEIVIGMTLPENIIMRAPKLKWIQSALAGTDLILTPEVTESPVIVTKARIHATQISEAVFNMMLMLARHSLEYFRLQEQKEWKRLTPSILESKTVGILGLGNIGDRVAKLAKSFRMRVIATRAHPELGARNVDLLLPSSGFRHLLKESDYVAILLPITSETRNLLGESALRLMKPDSYLINVSRGGVVVEDDLIRALSEKWIAGAALDVFVSDPAPLPLNSKLWTLPNVIITPHIAGGRPDGTVLLTDLFCKNLRHYMRGKELLNIVDKRIGY